VGIFGASGAGKSTILDVMMGLLKPDSGSILIDGVDVNSSQILKNSWRSIVSYVSQNIYLIDGTILENIVFSNLISN
jgi:ABC-type bacteriocin/lantibiotic exporter with double-glycine peptidase domain